MRVEEKQEKEKGPIQQANASIGKRDIQSSGFATNTAMSRQGRHFKGDSK